MDGMDGIGNPGYGGRDTGYGKRETGYLGYLGVGGGERYKGTLANGEKHISMAVVRKK